MVIFKRGLESKWKNFRLVNRRISSTALENVSSPVSSRYIGICPLNNKEIESGKTHERLSVGFHVYNKDLASPQVVLGKKMCFVIKPNSSYPKVVQYWSIVSSNSSHEAKVD